MDLINCVVHLPAEEDRGREAGDVVKRAQQQPATASPEFEEALAKLGEVEALHSPQLAGINCAVFDVAQDEIYAVLHDLVEPVIKHGLMMVAANYFIYATGADETGCRINTNDGTIPWASPELARFWLKYTSSIASNGYSYGAQHFLDFITVEDVDTADANGATFYIQSAANPDGSLNVEVREGSADAHFCTVVPTLEDAEKLFDVWFETRGRGNADWEKLEL